MQRYLLRTVRFLVPLALIIIGLELAVRAIPNNYTQHHERLTLHSDSIKVLILGNSHAYRGVDPLAFPVMAYNAANISQDHRRDLAILRRHIGDMPALRQLVVAVSYASICTRMESSSERWRLKNYVLYMDLPVEASEIEHHAELLNGKPRDALQDLLQWWLHRKDHVDCAPLGGAPWEPQGPMLDDYAVKAAQRHTCTDENRMQQNMAYLTEIVRLARQHGVHVHLFFPPATEAYRRLLVQDQLSAVRRSAQELAASHPHVTWHDLLDDPRFTDDDFVNADHLQREGCRKLTAILLTDLGYAPLPETLDADRNRP